MSAIQLIVGLANPGKAYAKTRHNAGAWFVETLAQDARIDLHVESKYHALHGQASFSIPEEHTCHLLIPTTFMNLSGQSVAACMRYFKIKPDAILVAHDDIDLPAGTIRLKFDGGDGGHNGLKDIIQRLGSKQFYRLRIGVSRPPHKDVVDYVLKPPSKVQRQLIDDAMNKACATLPLIISGQMQKAMQALHTNTDAE